MVLASCSNDSKQKPYTYKAINKTDTSILYLTLTNSSFYGKLERSYINLGKDIGEVRGKIVGDTLLGSYFYKHLDEANKKRIPIALLKRGNKLILGKGAIGSYMQISYFAKEIPIDYSQPEFVYEKIADK